jgi:putative membrane protein
MMMGAGMIGMVVFWALLIWGAVYLATRVTKQDAPHPSSAVDILEQRYARGEIDRDELESRRGTLRQG